MTPTDRGRSGAARLTADDIPTGSIWRVRANGFEWEVLERNYDGPGTFRTVMLNVKGERTTVYDTVWTDEILRYCERVDA